LVHLLLEDLLPLDVAFDIFFALLEVLVGEGGWDRPLLLLGPLLLLLLLMLLEELVLLLVVVDELLLLVRITLPHQLSRVVYYIVVLVVLVPLHP